MHPATHHLWPDRQPSFVPCRNSHSIATANTSPALAFKISVRLVRISVPDFCASVAEETIMPTPTLYSPNEGRKIDAERYNTHFSAFVLSAIERFLFCFDVFRYQERSTDQCWHIRPSAILFRTPRLRFENLCICLSIFLGFRCLLLLTWIQQDIQDTESSVSAWYIPSIGNLHSEKNLKKTARDPLLDSFTIHVMNIHPIHTRKPISRIATLRCLV